MNELQLISHQQPGLVSIDNFVEMKDALAKVLVRYENIVYTEDSLKAAKDDKKNLARLRKDIDDRRKEVKRAYLAPYNDFEAQVKELLAMVDAPLNEIKGFIAKMDEREKLDKRKEIEAYFFRQSGALGDFAAQVLASPTFFESKWLNKTTSAKTWQAAVDDKIAAVAWDLQTIQATAGQHVRALTVKYLETLSTASLAEYRGRLDAAAQVENAHIRAETEDCRTGSRVLRLTGNTEQLVQAVEMLALLGLDCEVLKDDLPQPMIELTAPDFDSFVCFDLETSGTYGAANGDAPAEITEIGAVRVEHGKIVEQFSMLVNPGRKILPRISHITGITNDMVAEEPGVEEAIRRFSDFVGECVLVGHNIKSFDLHYIDRAARRAGVRLENQFFDTCRFARQLKEAQGWEKVTLEYLSEFFGIQQQSSHRAWCDAQANAALFFKLKELAE